MNAQVKTGIARCPQSPDLRFTRRNSNLGYSLLSAKNRSKQCTKAAVLAPSPSFAGPTAAPTDEAVKVAFSDEFVEEQLTERSLSVAGDVPQWLKGLYVRNGPGAYKGTAHMFDGYGILAKFRFEDGQVFWSQRFVQSEAYKAMRETGKMGFSEFGSHLPPAQALLKIFTELSGLGQGFTDNASVNVLPGANASEFIAVSEPVRATTRIDKASLAALGRVKYEDNMPGSINTVHPFILPSGDLVNILTEIGGGYTVVRYPPGSTVREKIADIPLSHSPSPAWVHDFPATSNYIVLPETPALYNIKATLFGGAPYVMYDWKPELGTKLHLVSLKSGAVRTFDAPNYFTFHYINAFETEDGKSFCFDVACGENPEILANLGIEAMRSGNRSIARNQVRRFTIPLEEGDKKVEMKPLMNNDDDYLQSEMPRVNPDFKGLPYRYAYSFAAVQPNAGYANALCKLDLVSGEVKLWHEPGTIPSEPYMVPRRGDDSAEDDGVVLSCVVGADGKPFLLILNAASFSEVARCLIPAGLPQGFHAAFIRAKA